MDRTREEHLEGLLAVHLGVKLQRERAATLRDARAAHSGLLNVFFQVESAATAAEIGQINRTLRYLDKHIKALEPKVEDRSAFRDAKREAAGLYR